VRTRGNRRRELERFLELEPVVWAEMANVVPGGVRGERSSVPVRQWRALVAARGTVAPLASLSERLRADQVEALIDVMERLAGSPIPSDADETTARHEVELAR